MTDIVTQKTSLTDEEIISFIKKGIENAQGSPDALVLITEDDCTKLGEQLASREVLIKKSFFSVVVEPINNIEEGKQKGHYDSIYDHISEITVPLQQAAGPKRIYFVLVNEQVPEGKEAEFLAKYGKKPVTNAPNYLLGAMAKLEESDLPEELELKDFVAVSSDEKEVFRAHDGNPCFLGCNRRRGGRELGMVLLARDWRPGNGWYFLAEDL